MEKMLKNLKWKLLWTSHIGCLKGCINYLGLDVSLPWLFGTTGHAFLLNIHEVVCPSGPTAWKFERFLELGRNIGYEVEYIHLFKAEEGFDNKQKQAWEMIKAAIDNGNPCYGWELKIPEFYVINGYDDVGYYYSGVECCDGEGPRPWQEVGATDLGWLAMFKVKPCQPADYKIQVKDAFDFALKLSKSPDKYIFPKYKAGLEGYDLWMNSLEAGTASPHGMAYNTEVWLECREYAVKFLIEAKDKTGKGYEKLFDDAIAHYRVVADNLEKVKE